MPFRLPTRLGSPAADVTVAGTAACSRALTEPALPAYDVPSILTSPAPAARIDAAGRDKLV